MKRNVPIFGFLIGILAPMLGMLVVYLIITKGAMPVGEFVKDLVRSHEQASRVLSLSMLAEVLPFIYFTNKRLDQSAKGVLVATMLYALLIILLKFVWS